MTNENLHDEDDDTMPLNQADVRKAELAAEYHIAFVEGAKWACKQYSEDGDPLGDHGISAAEKQARINLRVRDFNLVPQTVFLGYVEYTAYKNTNPCRYTGPVLVSTKFGSGVMLSTAIGTVNLDDETLSYRIDSIIYDPTKSNN